MSGGPTLSGPHLHRLLSPLNPDVSAPKNPHLSSDTSTSRCVKPVSTVDTQSHFCPDPDCSYHGWLGRGNIRSNGHPGGQPWRQLQCVSCKGYFYETEGTIFHGKRSSPELIGHVIACLAEGLGIRGTARVFEIDANPVLHWLMEAAEQL